LLDEISLPRNSREVTTTERGEREREREREIGINGEESRVKIDLVTLLEY